jgi:acetylornithine deacetylase
MLSPLEEAALDSLDEIATVATLMELIGLRSIGGSPGEVSIQQHLAERLTDLGLDLDLWPIDLPALREHPDYPGEEVSRTEAWGLVGSSASTGTPALVLQGHVDVVPPGDRAAWSSDPFTPTLRDGEIVGRGSCDMLGGVAAILAAVVAVKSCGAALLQPYAVHCVIGEEDGGLGAFATLQRGHRGLGCIIPEPTALTLVTANAGALTFRIEVAGLATHGSTAYAGSSAVDAYVGIHHALAELQQRRNADPEPLMTEYRMAYPLSVGRVQAGNWPSSVPDQLVAEGRYGLRIEEDPRQARAELEAVVAEAAAAHPYLRDHLPVVTWPGGQFSGGHLPPGDPLRELVLDAHLDVVGTPTYERGAPWGSDLRLYAGAGVPTLHYGPGEVSLAHGPDERVPVSELMATARVLTVAILRRCGVR